MTDCNTQTLLFSHLKNKKILADFNGGSLTSDAGALHLREVDKCLGIIDVLNRCIPDPRNEFFMVHQQKTMLAQRTRLVVTNLDGDPQKRYDEVYCRRGDMENRIKEQQLHLFADRTPN